MPLEVHPCIASDFPRACEVERLAFAENPFTPVLFPGPFPEGGDEFRAQEMAKMLEDPHVRWLKVIDTDRPGELAKEGIAFAKWNVYNDKPPGPVEMRKFGPGSNVEACELVFGGLAKMRDRSLADKKCIHLHILITDPAHQGRGAGGKLISWGVEEAKGYKLPLYVESTPKGHGLYRKYGFRDLEVQEIDLSKWGPKELHVNWSMVNDNV